MKLKPLIYVALVLTAGAAQAGQKPRVWSDGLRPPAPEVSQKPIQNQRRTLAPSQQPVDAVVLPTQAGAGAPPAVQQVQPASTAGQSIEEGASLNLLCFGGGSANKSTYTTVDGTSSMSGTVSSNGNFASFDGSGTSSATIMGQRSQGFEDQVSLRIQAQEGRVRMPRTMLPVIRGGEDGWFKLKDIQIKPNEITASVAVNVLNNPKLRLDRYTGSISISGKAGDYSGRCRRFDPEQMQRQF